MNVRMPTIEKYWQMRSKTSINVAPEIMRTANGLNGLEIAARYGLSTSNEK